jgi:pimeloyl-ACP methyl ester carboxylesterase
MRTLRALVAIALLAAVVGGCTRQPDPPAGSKRISVHTPDGQTLDGIELGDGPDVAVLSHGATGTKEDFYGLASGFARDGWRVIAYDARGVGASTGDEDFDTRDVDLRAVVDYARRTGARTVVLAGGSLGASLTISMAQELHADAIVSLSAPQSTFDAFDAARRIGSSIPAFVAAAADNQPYADDARRIATALHVEPVIVPGDGHGTGMLRDHPSMIRQIVSWADDAVGRSG